MGSPIRLELNEVEQGELAQMRDHAAKPYLRERAAALLKVAQGQSAREVALHGLHKVRDPDSIYAWIERYRKAGIGGLKIRAGRGRKGAFFPSASAARQRSNGVTGHGTSPA